MFDYTTTSIKNKFTRCLERLAGKCFFFVFRFREIWWCPRGHAWQPSPSGSGGCDREAQDQRYSEKVNYWKKIIFWSKIYRYSHLYGLKRGIIGCFETRKNKTIWFWKQNNSKSALTQKNRFRKHYGIKKYPEKYTKNKKFHLHSNYELLLRIQT